MSNKFSNNLFKFKIKSGGKNMKLSKKAIEIQPSLTLEITAKAKKWKQKV